MIALIMVGNHRQDGGRAPSIDRTESSDIAFSIHVCSSWPPAPVMSCMSRQARGLDARGKLQASSEIPLVAIYAWNGKRLPRCVGQPDLIGSDGSSASGRTRRKKRQHLVGKKYISPTYATAIKMICHQHDSSLTHCGSVSVQPGPE